MYNIQKDYKNILNKISTELDISLKEIGQTPQGMDSEVFSVIDENGKEYVIKIGEGVNTDIEAYRLINEAQLDIPIPTIYLSTSFEDTPVLVMEKIKYPLLESIDSDDMYLYISSMIETQKMIHAIYSKRTGYLTNNEEKRTWKEFHLSKFDGKDEYLKWNEISKREGLDRDLILSSLDKFISKFSKV